jgi:type I restriction enzyme R subunit
MQTIARANRVSEGKSNGLIIDYIGIVKALRKALADYTANTGGLYVEPAVNKNELIARIIETIGKTREFLSERDYDLDLLIQAADFTKMSLVKSGANAACGSIEERKTFTTYASELERLGKYLDRDDVDDSVRKECDAIAAIYSELKKKRKHVDTTDLMVEINAIINEYVEIDDAAGDGVAARRFDISKIDFDLLRREFARAKNKKLILKDLQEIIQQKLDKLLFANPNRVDYYERYQEIIEAYNEEMNRADIEKTFADLMELADSLSQEEQRFVREGFTSDEELSLYDLLFKDDLTKAEIKKLKTVAVDLLEKIKAKIAELDHWTDKQETRDEVANLIRDVLWEELPGSYDEASIYEHRQLVYEYVYTRYRAAA